MVSEARVFLTMLIEIWRRVHGARVVAQEERVAFPYQDEDAYRPSTSVKRVSAVTIHHTVVDRNEEDLLLAMPTTAAFFPTPWRPGFFQAVTA
jgi:hypothetical protein